MDFWESSTLKDSKTHLVKSSVIEAWHLKLHRVSLKVSLTSKMVCQFPIRSHHLLKLKWDYFRKVRTLTSTRTTCTMSGLVTSDGSTRMHRTRCGSTLKQRVWLASLNQMPMMVASNSNLVCFNQPGETIMYLKLIMMILLSYIAAERSSEEELKMSTYGSYLVIHLIQLKTLKSIKNSLIEPKKWWPTTYLDLIGTKRCTELFRVPKMIVSIHE